MLNNNVYRMYVFDLCCPRLLHIIDPDMFLEGQGAAPDEID
jgi:hypothetical protein